MVQREIIDNTDNDGSDFIIGPLEIDDIEKSILNKYAATFDNRFDVSVTVTPELALSDDPDFTVSIEKSNISLNAGTDATDSDDRAFSWVRFVCSPGGDPTSGEFEGAVQTRRLG